MSENYNNPVVCAEIFGEVEKDNYLAHTIRAIEKYLLRKRMHHYFINTYSSERMTSADCKFFEKGCDIRLPKGDGTKADDKGIRLSLAHELGHIVFNFNNLDNFDFLNSYPASAEEEIFAWEFANALIIKKSRGYEKENYSAFIYQPRELKDIILGVVKNKSDVLLALEYRIKAKP
ncbi:MAG: hypothetical protein LBP55_05225 [Candidatus Adiutrix sp.]|nr:hypothetical protein [Candidatus Adiutrix sp.]